MQRGGDLVYQGGSKKLVCLNFSMNFTQILSKLHEAVGVDSSYVKLNVLMRYRMV